MDQHRYERVQIETQRHRIEGTLTLARDGYRSRVSDVLNAAERDFVPLTDVTVCPLDNPADSSMHPFLIVARQQIVLAIPMEERPSSSPPPMTSL